ncbi:MAG: DUF1565 domain-containing protein, partial [Chloroflexaceae bacterium]|nr:DUF1565 domain-containing protein [Chloroflexaceae bacterium]
MNYLFHPFRLAHVLLLVALLLSGPASVPVAAQPAASQGEAEAAQANQRRVYLPLVTRGGSSTTPPANPTPTPTPPPTTPPPVVPPLPPTAPPPLPPPTANMLWVAPNGVDEATRGTEQAPLRTLAYACSRAQTGQTIRLAAGEFRESAQCVLRSGVRLLGNGRSGASRSIVYAPAAWDFSGDGTNDNPAGYVVRIENVQNVTVDQLEFRGNSNRANGAVRVSGSQRVTLRDFSVYDFRFTGVAVRGSSNVDAQNLYIENSGYEWPPRSSSQFPDGGSVGNLGVHDVQDSVFAFITIKTTDLRGYGIKAANLSRVRFNNLDLDMHPFQSWMGPGPGNFDMEIHGGYAELVEISHSRFRQTISLMGGNEPRYDAVPYSIHVHHNMFDMKNNTYSVEVGTDKMVFDHNWFRNTWTALQNYGDSNTRIQNLTVFNNVVENLSMRFVGLKGRVENLRVFGNTVYLGPG